MNLSNLWRHYFASLVSNDDGNRNCVDFTLALDLSKSDEARLKSIVEEIDTVVPGCACFLPAPFLRDFIISEDSKDPFELIPKAITMANSFCDENDEVDADVIKKHTEDFVLWAWGVKKGKVTEARHTFKPDDREIETFAKERHEGCINPSLQEEAEQPTSSAENASVLKQLSESIARSTEEAGISNDLQRKELDLRIEKDERSKDRFNDLHSSFKNMIVMASSDNNNRAADKLGVLCQNFINKKNPALADQELNHMFEEMGLQDAGFAHGLVQHLHAGLFTYCWKA